MTGFRKEYAWQKNVVTQFFKVGKPLREGTSSLALYQQLNHALSNGQTFVLDGHCQRSFIIALSKILSQKGAMPNLILKLGPTLIEFRCADEKGRQRQRGNFNMYIPSLDRYQIAYGAGCEKRINRLLESYPSTADFHERQRQLLSLIEKRLVYFTPFTHENFNPYGRIALSDEAIADPDKLTIQENIDFLNGLLFLILVVEVLVRLYRTQEGRLYPYADPRATESDLFPVAIAQARSLSLLIAGQISFRDFVGEPQNTNYDPNFDRADYGAVTGKSLIDDVDVMKLKLSAINEKYNNQLISMFDMWKDFCQLRVQVNEKGYFVEGPSQMYCDLSETYGSGGESDDEEPGYLSSDDELKVVLFKR